MAAESSSRPWLGGSRAGDRPATEIPRGGEERQACKIRLPHGGEHAGEEAAHAVAEERGGAPARCGEHGIERSLDGTQHVIREGRAQHRPLRCAPVEQEWSKASAGEVPHERALPDQTRI